MGIRFAAVSKVSWLISIIKSLVDVLHHLKSMAMEAVSVLPYISFLRERPDPEQEQPELSHDIIVMDGLFPSLVPVPTHILESLIKDRSPVLQYGAYLEKHRVVTVQEEQHENCAWCAVCLGRISESDEIRELCNCSHVFHRDCLDSWVDEKKVTCPLCRADLFPAVWNRKSFRGDPWKTEMKTTL
ncbi:RING-H2 finger protein ATL47-like [Punica granatum]|uniref:RING-type domain-containing protein n=2 Tax=Punica granatum TaxID=22663 RepID=A0A218XK25_PUNGR|nr:RING-H2 finger protein ATL47-like [Punica granatum]OWM85158.1 hypothetical protein CDL15_Pgr027945 [Punica granatum]PKI75024.1 hypothetical protein CRG98_004592 [Punica granatum]